MAQTDAGHYVLLNPQLARVDVRAPSAEECAKSLAHAFDEFVSDVAQTSLGATDAPTPSGLTRALLVAYNTHADVALRPDDLWLVVAHTFACQVLSDPERYRNVFVEHAGKKELVVDMTGRIDPDMRGDWVGFVAQICAQIDGNVRGDEARALLAALQPDFSTTKPLDHSLAQMLVMCGMQEFFCYKMTAMCGLRGVRLMGTVADWERLIVKTRALSAALPGFDWYYEHIRPVLELMLATRRLDPATMTYEPIDIEAEERATLLAAGAFSRVTFMARNAELVASRVQEYNKHRARYGRPLLVEDSAEYHRIVDDLVARRGDHDPAAPAFNFDLPAAPTPADIRRMWNRIATCYPIGSGSDIGYSGWVVRLCPFEITIDDKTRARRAVRDTTVMREHLSAHVCSVPVLVNSHGAEHKMAIVVGHAGVRVTNGCFAPVPGYVIGHAT